MKKIRLVLADPDVTYMESVMMYLRSSSDGPQFDVKMFSKPSHLQQYIDDGRPIDILLVSSDFDFQKKSIKPIGVMIVLEDDRISSNEYDYPTLFKYQPLNQLISGVLSIYYEQKGHLIPFSSEEKRAKVIAVYSASGGTGKTTLAVNLARQLAVHDKRVFYLNLELINSTSLYYTSPEDEPSSQILYYTKTKQDQLVSKIESLKKYHPNTTVEYFDLAINVEEMLDLTEAEVTFLISGLIDSHHYDFIIIDLDSFVNDRVKAALNQCDQVLWVVNNELNSFHKTHYVLTHVDEIFGKEMSIQEKSHLILNRCSGSIAEEFQRFDLTFNGYIPHVSELQGLKNSHQVLSTTLFTKELLETLGLETESEKDGMTYG